tara:strand:+ start:716 stop:1075 length:360 start_codon:yes stop_codon:yes gene_type:complete
MLARLLIFAVGFVFLTTAWKMIPAYLEYQNVKELVASLPHKPGITAMTSRDLRRLVLDELKYRSIEGLDKSHVKVERLSPREKVVSINYERWVVLFGNLTAAMTFGDQVTLGQPRDQRI